MKQKYSFPVVSLPVLQCDIKDTMPFKISVYEFGQIPFVASLVKPASQEFLSHNCSKDQMREVICKLLGKVCVHFSFHVTEEMSCVLSSSIIPPIKVTHFYYYSSFNLRHKHLNQFTLEELRE